MYPYDIDPWLFGPDWDDDSDQSAQNDYGGNIPAPYADYGESRRRIRRALNMSSRRRKATRRSPIPQTGSVPYLSQDAPSSSPRQPYTGGSAAPGPQQALTLIFNNGRPPEAGP